MSEALTLVGIEKAYNRGQPNEVSVLRGASLTVSAGEVVALVAPSGAGKSTLLHIAGLLDTADAGRVSLGGTDMTDLNDKRRTIARRREAGFVYQFHHLLPEFSAAGKCDPAANLANGVATPEGRRPRALACWPGSASADRARSPPGGVVGRRTATRRVSAGRWPTNQASCCWRMSRTGNLDPGTADTGVRGADGTGVQVAPALSALIATHNLALAARMDRVVRMENGSCWWRVSVTRNFRLASGPKSPGSASSSQRQQNYPARQPSRQKHRYHR